LFRLGALPPRFLLPLLLGIWALVWIDGGFWVWHLLLFPVTVIVPAMMLWLSYGEKKGKERLQRCFIDGCSLPSSFVALSKVGSTKVPMFGCCAIHVHGAMAHTASELEIEWSRSESV
jgi:hypothetical protein